MKNKKFDFSTFDLVWENATWPSLPFSMPIFFKLTFENVLFHTFTCILSQQYKHLTKTMSTQQQQLNSLLQALQQIMPSASGEGNLSTNLLMQAWSEQLSAENNNAQPDMRSEKGNGSSSSTSIATPSPSSSFSSSSSSSPSSSSPSSSSSSASSSPSEDPLLGTKRSLGISSSDGISSSKKTKRTRGTGDNSDVEATASSSPFSSSSSPSSPPSRKESGSDSDDDDESGVVFSGYQVNSGRDQGSSHSLDQDGHGASWVNTAKIARQLSGKTSNRCKQKAHALMNTSMSPATRVTFVASNHQLQPQHTVYNLSANAQVYIPPVQSQTQAKKNQATKKNFGNSLASGSPASCAFEIVKELTTVVSKIMHQIYLDLHKNQMGERSVRITSDKLRTLQRETFEKCFDDFEDEQEKDGLLSPLSKIKKAAWDKGFAVSEQKGSDVGRDTALGSSNTAFFSFVIDSRNTKCKHPQIVLPHYHLQGDEMIGRCVRMVEMIKGASATSWPVGHLTGMKTKSKPSVGEDDDEEEEEEDEDEDEDDDEEDY